MSDTLGNITVPEIVPSGTFPIVGDYPHGGALRPEVVVHQFGSGNAKIEQRFVLGRGAKRFQVRRAWLNDSQRRALRDFWEDHYGPYGAFTYNAPNDDGVGATAYTCRFANEPLSWQMLTDAICTVGVTLIEIPATSPTYALNAALMRFPSQTLNTALLAQVQEMIPLVKVQPLQAGYPAIYVSDRRCTVGGQLYLARLLDFDGISQGTGNESDQATFVFGNADRVMRDLANDVDLYRAAIEFSLFHVGRGTKLDLWKGDVVDWTCDAGPECRVTAADGLYELRLPYPTRKISRTCPKQFNDPNACPYSTQGAMDYTHFPSADPTKCDKGYDTPNGCLAHGMKRYYRAILAQPQGVRIKDNSTGTWGFGRSTITSVSLVADSIYEQVMPEIYTDAKMPVNCKIAMGRDESDFYEALGIIGEGPLGYVDSDVKLDDQLNHAPYSPRVVLGNDPAGSTDFFSLDQSGDQTGGDWRKVYSGNSTFADDFAAGTAFAVVRRSDAKGLQLSRPAEHAMVANVVHGLSGWVWSAAGSRSWQLLSNPIWIAINMVLRARGLYFADAATCEQYFDVEAALAAAAICNQFVDKLVGTGTEQQFRFRGALQEEKPLRDWLQEVLMNCLGYYTFAFGKLRLGIRSNSSAVEAFTLGNILFNSLQLSPLKPSFNHLTANFADQDYDFVVNSAAVYDADHASLLGGGAGPLFLKSDMNLAGTSTKSQAARIISTRLREELGGITQDEWKAARQLTFRTTVLALSVEPGMVCSMTHPDMPGGAGEFRVTSWRLNKDYSIDIQGRTTTDSMYDLTIGPKPADVEAAPIPIEAVDLVPGNVQPIGGNAFLVATTEDGINASYGIAYDPPATIGVFAGVTLHLEVPDGARIVKLTQDADYNGDPAADPGSAARRGTLKFSFPQNVDGPTNVRLYLTARSRSYKRPLIFHGDYDETPNIADTISQADLPGAPTPPAQPLTVAAGEYGSRASGPEGHPRWQLRVTVTLPSAPYSDEYCIFEFAWDGVKAEYVSQQPIASTEQVYDASVSPEFLRWCPTADTTTCKVRVRTGRPGAESPAGSGTWSNAFTVTKVANCTATEIAAATMTNAADSYKLNADGMKFWGPDFSVTAPTNPEHWLLKLYIQWVNASGQLNPDWGDPTDHKQEVWEREGRGVTIKVISDRNWPIPQSTDPYPIARLSFWCVSYNFVETKQTQVSYNGGGATDHFDFAPDGSTATLNASRLAEDTLGGGLGVDGGKLGVRVTGGLSIDGQNRVAITSLNLALATPGTLETAAFAAGIRPVALLPADPALPAAAYPPGTLIYNTTAQALKKVRPDGNGWVAAVNGQTDVIANSITGGLIAAGAISTQHFAAAEVLVGQGGGKPSRFKVVDTYGVARAFLGADANGFFNWFYDIRIGPDINNPVVYGSSAGVSIIGASITVTGGSTQGTIRINTTDGLSASYGNSTSYLRPANLRCEDTGYGTTGYYGAGMMEMVGPSSTSITGTTTLAGSAYLRVQGSAGRAFYAYASSTSRYVDVYTLQVNGSEVFDASRNLKNLASLAIGSTTVISSSRQIGDWDPANTVRIVVRESGDNLVKNELTCFWDSGRGKQVIKVWNGVSAFYFVAE